MIVPNQIAPEQSTGLIQGLVIRSQAGFLTVRTPRGDILCRLRGRLRKGKPQGDLVAVGDQVLITVHPDGDRKSVV